MLCYTDTCVCHCVFIFSPFFTQEEASCLCTFYGIFHRVYFAECTLESFSIGITGGVALALKTPSQVSWGEGQGIFSVDRDG